MIVAYIYQFLLLHACVCCRLSRLSGYSQSKWVGETVVLKAMEKKLIQGSISRYKCTCYSTLFCMYMYIPTRT